MSIIINTNIPAMIARNAMDYSTARMTRSMVRLSTGTRLNSAKDDPTGSYMAARMMTKLRGIQVAYQNVGEASNILTTAENAMTIINDHLDRIKELTEECMSSTLSEQQYNAIVREVKSRVEEIDRISGEAEFNDVKILDGTFNNPSIQVGPNANDASNSLVLRDVFGSTKTDQDGLGLFGGAYADVDAAFATPDDVKEFFGLVNSAIDKVSMRKTNAGIYQSRLESIANLLLAENENVSSAYSTISDTDIATETTEYVKYQILQQTASTLLSQANQNPGVMALRLINAMV